MAPRTKVTPEGQIFVPPEILEKLGIEPGSVLEWEVDGDRFVGRQVDGYTSEDIHRMLFPNGPPKRRSLEELKEAIPKYIREKHGRR